MASLKIIEVDDYIPFSIELLPSGIRIPFDIFMFEENQMKPVINKGNYFTTLLKNSLKEKNHKHSICSCQCEYICLSRQRCIR